MVKISESVERAVNKSPYIQELLTSGLANLSALARKLRPQIEQQLIKSVTESSIVMALKRLQDRHQQIERDVSPAIQIQNISVRSGLTEFTLTNHPSLTYSYKVLIERLSERPDVFFNITQGVMETTIIVSASERELVEQIFSPELFGSIYTDLSAVTMRLPQQVVTTPGAYHQILGKLVWAGINLVEVVSTNTELTIIFADADVSRAFEVLKG